MMSCGIWVVELAGSFTLGTHALTGPLPIGAWVASYDPEGDHRAGACSLTHDPNEALRFHTARDAWALWQRQSVTRPVRSDGQPNRPLTAFSIVLRPLPPLH
jgi:hypothetical protein